MSSMFSLLSIPLVAALCPAPQPPYYYVTKEACEEGGCKCALLSTDPTRCNTCGECAQNADCTDASRPACALGVPTYHSTCVECNRGSEWEPRGPDCTSSSDKPACYRHECVTSCGTSNYQCQEGVRIDAKDHRAATSDGACCGVCNSDADCPHSESPHCLTYDVGFHPDDTFWEADVGQCHECMSSDHCQKSACERGQCKSCRDVAVGCLEPCMKGNHYECRLPCTQDSDCYDQNEICVYSSGAMRCEMQCTRDDDCVDRFGRRQYWATCLQPDGRKEKFCGATSGEQLLQIPDVTI